MKKAKSWVLAAILAMGIGMTTVAGAESQQWRENGVGSFNALAAVWVSGADLSIPGLGFVSGATGWSSIGNSHYAFAAFNPTNSIDFNLIVTGSTGDYKLYAYDGDLLKDSALVHYNSFLASPAPGIAPTRMEAFALAGGVAPVPEPETYAMLLGGLGLLGFVVRRRRRAAS